MDSGALGGGPRENLNAQEEELEICAGDMSETSKVLDDNTTQPRVYGTIIKDAGPCTSK